MSPKQALEGFLKGALTRNELEQALGGLIEVDFKNDQRSVTNAPEMQPEVVVRPSDVSARLRDYLDQRISAQELSEWASLIQLVGAYTWLEGDRETPEGERAWVVVQELSEPPISRSVNPVAVREKLERLAKPLGSS